MLECLRDTQFVHGTEILLIQNFLCYEGGKFPLKALIESFRKTTGIDPATVKRISSNSTASTSSDTTDRTYTFLFTLVSLVMMLMINV
ncbi:hypothetical protein TNCV_4079801 [Trichonephila clavipes]|nr:hypothetical protein TNCV_4079801 [Trichonephila clavipes]